MPGQDSQCARSSALGVLVEELALRLCSVRMNKGAKVGHLPG